MNLQRAVQSPSQLPRWERLFIGITVFVCAGAIFSQFTGTEGGSGLLYTISDLANPVLFLGIIGMYALRPSLIQRALRILRSESVLLVLLLLGGASVLWSVDPGQTLRRVIAWYLATGIGMYWFLRCRPDTFFQIVERTLLLIAVLSVLLVVFVPELGYFVDDREGNVWAGVFGHKNQFGRFMALGVITVFYRSESAYRWLKIAFFGLLLFLSTSKTAIMLVVLLMGLQPYFAGGKMSSKLKAAFFITIGTATVVTGTYVIVNIEYLLELIGRDITLSGRTVLWAIVLAQIAQNPILGHGLGGYSMLINVGILETEWASSAHNGYLEFTLSLGLVGTAVFVLLLLQAVARAVRGLVPRQPLSYMPVVVVLFVLLYSIFESVVMKNYDIFWSMLVYTYLGARHWSYDESVLRRGNVRRPVGA